MPLARPKIDKPLRVSRQPQNISQKHEGFGSFFPVPSLLPFAPYWFPCVRIPTDSDVHRDIAGACTAILALLCVLLGWRALVKCLWAWNLLIQPTRNYFSLQMFCCFGKASLIKIFAAELAKLTAAPQWKFLLPGFLDAFILSQLRVCVLTVLFFRQCTREGRYCWQHSDFWLNVGLVGH